MLNYIINKFLNIKINKDNIFLNKNKNDEYFEYCHKKKKYMHGGNSYLEMKFFSLQVVFKFIV